MSTLTPSFRRPNFIPPGAAHSSVISSIQSHDNSITDLNQANVAVCDRLSALEKGTPSTSSGTGTTTNTTTSTETVITNNIFSGGTVNNQSGQTLYRTQQADNGALLILNDTSPVAVQLNPAVTLPFWIFIVNQGSSLVNATPLSGVINYAGNPAAVSLPIPAGCFAIVAMDSQGNFWAATLPSGLTTTVTTAKLTSGGTEGSMQFVGGLLIAATPAT